MSVHSPATAAGCPPLSTGCPPVIHRLSPQACGWRRRSPLPLSPEPSTARTQVDEDRWITRRSSPGVHSFVHRVSPQPVGNWRRTDRSYQQAVDSKLWTTSGDRSGHGLDPVVYTMSRVQLSDKKERPTGDPAGRVPGCAPPRGGRTPQLFCLIRLVSSAIWLYSERRSAIC